MPPTRLQDMLDGAKRLLLLVRGDGAICCCKADPGVLAQAFGQEAAALARKVRWVCAVRWVGGSSRKVHPMRLLGRVPRPAYCVTHNPKLLPLPLPPLHPCTADPGGAGARPAAPRGPPGRLALAGRAAAAPGRALQRGRR